MNRAKPKEEKRKKLHRNQPWDKNPSYIMHQIKLKVYRRKIIYNKPFMMQERLISQLVRTRVCLLVGVLNHHHSASVK